MSFPTVYYSYSSHPIHEEGWANVMVAIVIVCVPCEQDLAKMTELQFMTRGHGTLGSPKSGIFQLGLFGHFYEQRTSGVIRASFTAFQSPQRTSTSSPSKMLDAGEALELEAACSPSYPWPHRSSFLSNMQTFVQRPH
jgi:hypothetical protein